MADQEDNRRRIKPELLSEIEEFEGTTFTEQLLNWNREQDTMSEKDLEEKFDRAMERFKDKIHYSEDSEDDGQDTLSYEDVRDAVDDVVRNELPEVLRNEMR